MSRTWIAATLLLLLAGCGTAPPPRSDDSPCATHGEASMDCQVYRYSRVGM